MATLTGQSIANSYKDLLQVSNSNSGIDSTGRIVSDGEGTSSTLYLSSSYVGVGAAGEAPLHVYKAAVSQKHTPDELLRLEQKDEGVDMSAGHGVALTFYVGETGGSDHGGSIAVVREAEGDADSSSAMTFYTAGDDTAPVEVMRLTSAGLLGIGTAAPTKDIEISGGTPTLRLDESDGTAEWDLYSSGNDFYILNEGQTAALVIKDTTGNVGMGDTNPTDAKLSIAGVASGDYGLLVEQDNANTAVAINQDGNSIALDIDTEATDGGSAIRINTPLQTASNLLEFVSADALTSGSAISVDCGSTALATTASGGLVKITHDADSDTNVNNLLLIHNDHADSSGTTCLLLDQDGNQNALMIDSEATTRNTLQIGSPTTTTANVVSIYNADGLTSGRIMYLHSNSSSTTARPLVEIHNENVAAVATIPLFIQQDSTEPVTIDHNLTATTTDTARSLFIDFDATGITASGQTATNIGLDLDMNSDSPTMVGTVNNTGLDLDVVGGTTGTTKNIGIDIAVSGADTNYAALFNGGNVGIGTAAPARLLNVVGATSDELIKAHNTGTGANHVFLAESDGSNASCHVIKAQSSGHNPIFVANADGNVGIGVAAPSTALDVAGTVKCTGIAIERTAEGGSALVTMYADESDDNADKRYVSVADGGLYTIQGYSTGSWVPHLAIDASGNVGIGTASPDFKLEVEEDVSGYVARFFNDGDDNNRFGIKITAGADDASGTTRYISCNDGDGNNVGYVANTSGTFALTDVSDERIKENIRDTEIEGLNTVNSMQVRDFEWKKSGDTCIGGFIAQELEPVFAHAVSGEDGKMEEYEVSPAIEAVEGIEAVEAVMGERILPMGVSRDRLVPVLVKAIQELSAKVEALENA